MTPFTEAFGRRWVWKRPHLWTRHYELRADDDLLASLDARGLLGGAMSGATAGGQWDLRHTGLLRGRVEVSVAGEAPAVATFRPRWFGAGDVTTALGQALRWHRADFWGRRWELVNAGGLASVVFERAPAFLSADTQVTVSDDARADGELEPVVLLGYYLLLLMGRRSRAAL